MEMVVVSPLKVVENPVTRYELPPEGISRLGYVVRRMHKTAALANLSQILKLEEFADALYQIAVYTAAATASFGKFYYEPAVDDVGTTITEQDPQTGALVSATLVKNEDLQYYRHMVQLPEGDIFSGCEKSGAAKMSFRGWIHPAKTRFQFTSVDEGYHASFEGDITREIVPRLVGPWLGRAHGSLKMEDNKGNVGEVTLSSQAKAIVTISSACGQTVIHREVDLV